MKAKDVFEVCHRRYRGLREWLADSTGAVRSIALDTPSNGYQWRPDRAPASTLPISNASGATRCAGPSGRDVSNYSKCAFCRVRNTAAQSRLSA